MSTREDLEAAIRQQVRTANDAERIGQAAELLAEYLNLEERARRIVNQLPEGGSDPSDLRGLSLHAAAERVLADAGLPLHVRELGARIKAGGWRHPRSTTANPQQILFQLAARLPRYPKTFRRVAPNTFALTRWETEGSSAKRRPPKTGLFLGPGSAIGRAIGESKEPISGEGSTWRSS
jgi:HB1, ASXL, restriction endonuclease HTH domain